MAIQTTLIGPAPRIAVDYAGAGPLVVFMHGIGGNRTNWREQIDALSGDFLCAAWDARGYGASDDYDGPLAFSHFNDDLLRVLDHFGRPAAHLVGLSMGGTIAQNFYRRHPQRVLSLVLADTRNGFQRHNSDEFLRRREAPLLAGLTPADIAPNLAPTLVAPDASREVVQRLTESIAALHKDSYLKALRASTLAPESEEFQGMTGYVDMATVRVPTLVICGTDDQVTPAAMSRELAEGIAGARLEMIDGAGHLSNVENPERFNEVLREFLRGRS
ncbi:MAG TPA: alpha/beta fold hydrolase [Casimicrobiaceae bacterium]|nr:alpha/beta fold hydrolase [Casimicrobiaceae bacterium]